MATHLDISITYAIVNSVINFLIVAMAIFFLIQLINRGTQKPDAVATTKDCPQCAMAIPQAAKRCGHCTALLA